MVVSVFGHDNGPARPASSSVNARHTIGVEATCPNTAREADNRFVAPATDTAPNPRATATSTKT